MKKIIFCMSLILFMLVINNSNAVEKQYTIYIDPGHGGIDQGAIGDEVHESEINLNISFALKERLEQLGFKTYMTRYGDYDLASDDATNRKSEDLHKRVELINDSDCDLYISIHTNAIQSNVWRGAQTFFKNDGNNSDLAKKIQDSLKQILNNTNRTEKEISGKFLIDNVNKLGVLVEVGFLSNEDEKKLLSTNEYQSIMSYAILVGILEYINI